MTNISKLNDPARQTANLIALKMLGLDEGLCRDFAGTLIPRDDTSDEYNRSRLLSNPAFDPHPDLIAVCTDRNDIRIAIDIAKASGLSPVCRSGGHSTAGYSSLDGVMVIDMKPMDGIRVSPAEKIAWIEAGAAFGKVNTEIGMASRHYLHVPGGACADVRVGGYMQGGGYGFTSRIFGMNIDSVRAFRMMLADGRIVTASRERNYDLFWAVRGGTGNNFGVLLDVEYDLHLVSDLRGFGLIWDVDRKDDPDLIPRALLKLQTDYMLTAEAAKFGYMLAFRKLKGKSTLLMRGVYLGSAQEASAWLSRLQAETGGQLEFKQLESYERLETIMMEQYHIDPDVPKGAKEDKQSGYIDRMLSLGDWREIVEYIKGAGPILNFVVIEPYGGRIAQIPERDSAFVHRSVHMDFYVDVWWVEAAEKTETVAWLDRFMTIMKPRFNCRTYQNYPRATFTDYPRRYWGIDVYTELCAIKKKYDPSDLFTFPQAIGRWLEFEPSRGIEDPKLTAAIAGDIAAAA